MSRAVGGKNRGTEKSKPPVSQTPVISHEIVPGKFNDSDWNGMLDRDRAHEFVMDIMDDLMQNTMASIYKNYIERQLLPFTITQAKDAIIEIIEWQFLARDEGEVSIDFELGWTQDEEPEPAETDCWAQGSVPKNVILAPSPVLEVIPEAEDTVQDEEKESEMAEKTQELLELDDVVSEGEDKTDMASQGEKEETKFIAASITSDTKSRSKFRPYKGKMKSAAVGKMTESLDETEMKMIYDEIVATMPLTDDRPNMLLNMPASCTSILKVQTGRPPGNKDVVYDDMGNVIAVMKLDPEKLPSHKIHVKYNLVDPAVEAAQARLDAMRKGKSTAKLRKLKSNRSLASDSVVSGPPKSKAIPSVNNVIAPLPPPLIEGMEVSHGVVVKEGGRVKKGPGRYYRKLDILEEHQKGMKPVSVRLANSGITVNDLLDRNTPILRPVGDSSPLPPIVPQPPPHPPASQVS